MTPRQRAEVVVGITAQVYPDLVLPTLLTEGIERAIEAAVAEEREVCARLCDDMVKGTDFPCYRAVEEAAESIRARVG